MRRSRRHRRRRRREPALVTSSALVASPHSSRCPPQSHTSPKALTGLSGAGASSSPVWPPVGDTGALSSPGSKPVRSRSKPKPSRSANSRPSSSSSQALSPLSRLSAMRYALAWGSVRSSATWTGTLARSSFVAASRRAWPTIMIPAPSTTMGWRQPNPAIDAATLSIAFCGMERGLRP